jgi:heme-degrading monooxygenase HmoA
MMLQLVEAVTLEGQDAQFEAALCEVRQRVFMTPGFRGWTVAQGAEQAMAYLVQVRWETVEELRDVVNTDRSERCWAPVQPLLARPLRVDHFVERPSLNDQGPGVVTDLAWLRT